MNRHPIKAVVEIAGGPGVLRVQTGERHNIRGQPPRRFTQVCGSPPHFAASWARY